MLQTVHTVPLWLPVTPVTLHWVWFHLLEKALLLSMEPILLILNPCWHKWSFSHNRFGSRDVRVFSLKSYGKMLLEILWQNLCRWYFGGARACFFFWFCVCLFYLEGRLGVSFCFVLLFLGATKSLANKSQGKTISLVCVCPCRWCSIVWASSQTDSSTVNLNRLFGPMGLLESWNVTKVQWKNSVQSPYTHLLGWTWVAR